MTSFSVVIPWWNRPELRRTLDANLPLLARHGAEVVVVDCGGDAADGAAQLAGYTAVRLRHVMIPDAGRNRSLARNLGALCSTGSVLFFLDCDVILRSDIFAEATPLLEEDCFLTVRKRFESKPKPLPYQPFLKELIQTRELVCGDGRRATVQQTFGADGSASNRGELLVKRAHFLRIGGYNSALEGWGFEDDDIVYRLQFVLGLPSLMTGEVVHLTHGNDLRGGSPPSDRRRNKHICFDNYSRGIFGGTYEEDVRLWKPRITEIVPTHFNGEVTHAHQ
jgi:glycosyltransferase involved in cell wall biosynthesis